MHSDEPRNQWFLHGPASTHCAVAIDAGFSLGAAAKQSDTFAGYSFEQLGMLEETGALVVRGDDPSLDILDAVAAFPSVPAVSAGRLFSTDYFYVASYAQCNALLADLQVGLDALSGV